MTIMNKVFFPILQEWHYYIIVYDFQYGKIQIIDNRKGNTSVDGMYDGLPEKLHNAFVVYLKFVGNLKCDHVHTTVLKKMVMKWQTSKDDVDIAVFAMRHMETYMGETGGKWECGLDMESKQHKAKIAKLRKKYAAKMLLPEHNVHQEHVLAYAKEFESKNRCPINKK